MTVIQARKKKHISLMEFAFPFTLLISFLAFLFLVVKILKNQSVNCLNLIPGPMKLPLIGNLHLFVGNPLFHHVFRDLSIKHGPLMHLRLGEVPFVVVSSVDVAKQVLKTHDITFANRPPMVAGKLTSYNYRDIGLSPYGEYWRHLQKICTLELLSARRVQYFRPIREEENMALARRIASNAGTAVNLSDGAYQLSFDITTRASIGKKIEHQESVTDAFRELLKLGSGLSVVDLFPSSKLLALISRVEYKTEVLFRRTDKLLGDILNQLAARDATERSEDLADVLFKYQQDDEAKLHLSIDNIKAVIMDMFLGGGDISANVIEWAMSEMMKNPIVLRRAQEEVRRVFDSRNYVDEAEFHKLICLKLVIKETLRLHPPLPLLVPHYSSEKCEINGYEIPAKTRLIINAWALGRDPEYWQDAEKFLPERFMDSSIDYKGNNLEYIPFGTGRRMCPGISFGIANVEFTLAMLLYHFDWEMPNGIKKCNASVSRLQESSLLIITEAFGATVTRKHQLHLIPTVRRPLKLLK